MIETRPDGQVRIVVNRLVAPHEARLLAQQIMDTADKAEAELVLPDAPLRKKAEPWRRADVGL